ncbi:hypothetical protein ACJ73_04168 [Blastomyces percursus]|uniref:Uncharacterized protein n=1 Tax=Blastomyces percursus TaxID=1658174 RepID=A0A1J9Q8U2_9EURO|nr:hypothetical protein ACJ73_04168 [Blastomyces percursus]
MASQQQQQSLQPYQHGEVRSSSASFHHTNHTAAADTISQQRAHQVASQHTSRHDTQGTAAFLRDFTLVAEAAKRAQMAVIARDLEGISL